MTQAEVADCYTLSVAVQGEDGVTDELISARPRPYTMADMPPYGGDTADDCFILRAWCDGQLYDQLVLRAFPTTPPTVALAAADVYDWLAHQAVVPFAVYTAEPDCIVIGDDQTVWTTAYHVAHYNLILLDAPQEVEVGVSIRCANNAARAIEFEFYCDYTPHSVITDKNTGLKLVSDLLDAGWKLIAPKQFNNFHDAFMSLSKGEYLRVKLFLQGPQYAQFAKAVAAHDLSTVTKFVSEQSVEVATDLFGAETTLE